MTKLLFVVFISTLLCSANVPVPYGPSVAAKNCKLKIGDKYGGGIIFYMDAGDDCHGMVCALSNQGVGVSWYDAVTICRALHLGGYSDWRLPSKEELNYMYTNLYKPKLADFPVNYYWSATFDEKEMAYAQYFVPSTKTVSRFVFKKYAFSVRAVRTF